jgi:transposase
LDWGVSNVLSVSQQEAIRSLHLQGWSRRRIARELGLHRVTVRRYLVSEGAGASSEPIGAEDPPLAKCTTISTPGSGAAAAGEAEVVMPAPAAKCTTISTAGSAQEIAGQIGGVKAASVGRKSRCEPLAERIAAKVRQGLSAQRVYQDLVVESGFGGSYQSVKRFVRKLLSAQPTRIQRLESQPGEEVQIDFGVGAPLVDEQGRRQRTWVLRAVLSYSRKGYSEAVLRQDTEVFLRCLENALRGFGGVPLLLNVDNLKAAVLQADWFDPEINPKLADFCRHYGLSVLPCRPRRPEHKGKVERGVGYVQGNALKGRSFSTLSAQNQYLAHWEENVADKRIHGTTCQQVAARFAEERPHLQPLPASLFPCYQEARRKVGRDSFVEVQRAFYEAPPEYIGRQVWVRWDSRCVRLFNDRLEQVQMHTRLEPGRFSRILGVMGLRAPVLKSCQWWVERSGLLGAHCATWAQGAIDARGPAALRSIIGLCHLSKKHTAAAIDAACGKALVAGAKRFKDVQRLLGTPSNQTTFAFAESHPLIRDLSDYGAFIQHHENPETTEITQQNPENTPST